MNMIEFVFLSSHSLLFETFILYNNYDAFAVFLANFSVGLAWYDNMLKGPRMQGKHSHFPSFFRVQINEN